ncbi:MAG: hypothetical protein MZV64_41575 [Ignavibacteriales bacterium]|nr:hypothetical protein [Ignavibacteriales bacterium]
MMKGNFVVVWADFRNDIGGIYFQRYFSSGIAQGINNVANDDLVGADHASISMDGEGNFVIVWIDLRNGNHDIFYQRYNSNGVTQAPNTKVNDDVGTAYQMYPSISRNGAGNFAIVWQEERNGNPDIYYQRYYSNGVPYGTNTKVNDDSGNVSQFYPRISMGE